MSEEAVKSMMHSMLHGAGPALCTTDWSEMIGDETVRTCPQCGGVAYDVTCIDPSKFCSESEKYRSGSGAIRIFRRIDGTYTFAELNCSPKKFLAPLKADLRGIGICNWWSDRFERYNKYLIRYGLAVGGLAALAILCFGQPVMALLYFGGCAVVSAIAANILFAACMVVNLIVPDFLAPVRKYSGPVLLAGSMAIIGGCMTFPLIGIAFVVIQQLTFKPH